MTQTHEKTSLKVAFWVFGFFFDNSSVLQLAAQVLDEFDDEEIGVGLLDAKLDKAVAKKLGNSQPTGADHC